MNLHINQDIKRFIVSTSIVLVLIAIADKVIGISFDYLMTNMPQTQAQASRTQYAITQAKADCIIIGSSRASEHYVSKIIADSIGMTVYNAGRDGHGIAYSDCVIHEIFNRFTPKIVVLEYDDCLICTSDHITINDLKPYYGKLDYTTKSLDMCNDWSFKISMMSCLFKYNNFPVRILEGYIKPRDTYDGYCSRGEKHINDEPITSELKLKENYNRKIDYFGERCLNDIIKLCEDNNSKLLLVTSPMYSKNYSNNPLLAQIIKNKKNIHVINDLNIPGFHMHPEWFSDHNHLNNPGAIEFSKTFASQLKFIQKKENKSQIN